jgi:hypothetical protein
MRLERKYYRALHKAMQNVGWPMEPEKLFAEIQKTRRTLAVLEMAASAPARKSRAARAGGK